MSFTFSVLRSGLLVCLLASGSSSFASSRFVDIDRELKEASYVGEIVFVGYDSIKVPRISETFRRENLEQEDSVWIISKVLYRRISDSTDSVYSADLYFNYSFSTYLSRNRASELSAVRNGYLPNINDSCLIVIRDDNEVSLFAEIHPDKYVFWDPYPNFGQLTVFAFDAPFEEFSMEGKVKPSSWMNGFVAEFLGKDKDCFFHCAISKADFKLTYFRT